MPFLCVFPIALSTILNVVSVLGESLFLNSNSTSSNGALPQPHIQHPSVQGALDYIYCHFYNLSGQWNLKTLA